MSQQAFAAAIGVSFATVNRWENGKAKPQRDRISRLKALMHEASAGRRASSLAVLNIGEVQDLAEQIHALTKPLAGLDPQIEVRITIMSKADGDLSEANSVLNKVKPGWKL